MKGAGPQAYRDVIPMMDAALRCGYIEFDMPSREAAFKAVQRMNQWRILHRKIIFENAKRDAPDPEKYRTKEAYWQAKVDYDLQINWYEGLKSPYDKLVIRRPIDTLVIIEVKPDRPFLAARDRDGNPIVFDEPSPQPTPQIIESDNYDPNARPDPHEPLNLDEPC